MRNADTRPTFSPTRKQPLDVLDRAYRGMNHLTHMCRVGAHFSMAQISFPYREWALAQYNDVKGNLKWGIVMLAWLGISGGFSALVAGLPWWRHVVLVILFAVVLLWTIFATWRRFAAESILDSRKMLSPLQVEALQLSRDLTAFLVELGPCPSINVKDYRDKADFIGKSLQISTPWYDRLWHGYKLRFAQRATVVYLRLGERGLGDPTAQQYVPEARQPEQIAIMARSLTQMIAKIEDANLPTEFR